MTCSKSSYPTKKAARTALNKRMRSRRNRPDHLRAYWCPKCGQWHLTHKTHLP